MTVSLIVQGARVLPMLRSAAQRCRLILSFSPQDQEMNPTEQWHFRAGGGAVHYTCEECMFVNHGTWSRSKRARRNVRGFTSLTVQKCHSRRLLTPEVAFLGATDPRAGRRAGDQAAISLGRA